jgi:ATP-dependent Clp protease adaptor protein ClpS
MIEGMCPDEHDHDDQDQEQGGVTAPTKLDPGLREPSKYAVILLNDDYSTMEFVVEVLQRFFQKTREEALQIMIRVHHEGRGLAGIYTRDIAETKCAQVQELARTKGFPLKCVIEKQ